MKYGLLILFCLCTVIGWANTPTMDLHVQDVDVRALLQQLTQMQAQNTVISDKVQGKISLHLDQVTVADALSIVVETQGLARKSVGSVLYIAPAADLLNQDKWQQQAALDRQQLGPLRNAQWRIHYGKAQQYYQTLKSGEQSLLSLRGKMLVNERTNQLFVEDTPDNLRAIGHYIASTDVPIQQVEIEARIVNVDNSAEQQLGIKWNVQGPTVTNTGGKTQETGFNLDLSASPIGTVKPGTIALATLASDVLIGLELSALEAEGNGEILSSPRLLTADQQEAVIEQGTEIPYNESTSSGAAAVAFKQAVLRLKVTPQLIPGKKILLKLEVNQDAKSKETTGNNMPIIDTRHISTNVMVNNGETVVLGGIYERQQSDTVTRVPFLSDIPLLGELFKHRSLVDNRKQLLIFVTPRIVNTDA